MTEVKLDDNDIQEVVKQRDCLKEKLLEWEQKLSDSISTNRDSDQNKSTENTISVSINQVSVHSDSDEYIKLKEDLQKVNDILAMAQLTNNEISDKPVETYPNEEMKEEKPHQIETPVKSTQHIFNLEESEKFENGVKDSEQETKQKKPIIPATPMNFKEGYDSDDEYSDRMSRMSSMEKDKDDQPIFNLNNPDNNQNQFFVGLNATELEQNSEYGSDDSLEDAIILMNEEKDEGLIGHVIPQDPNQQQEGQEQYENSMKITENEKSFEQQEDNEKLEEEKAEDELFLAVESQDLETIQHLLTAAPWLVPSVNSEDETIMLYACRLGHVNVVKQLLEFGLSFNTPDTTGRTGLHYCRSPILAELLCSLGADPNKPDEMGITPLHEIVMARNCACLKVLLLHGGDPMVTEPTSLRNALHLAADMGDLDVIGCLLNEAIVPVNINEVDQEGNTTIHYGLSSEKESFNSQMQMFMFLLDKGVSPVQPNDHGVTPLHQVCANRNIANIAEPIVEVLLSLQADPNGADEEGATPLIIACAYREWNLCQLLLEAGGDLNVPCSMASMFLQKREPSIASSKEEQDKKIAKLMRNSFCTASDLMPRRARYKLFRFISVPQTRIPGEQRDRCMNCAALFATDESGISSMFRFTSGKHHCRFCNRVVCQECSPYELPRNQMPLFIQDVNAESTMRVCNVCYAVL